MSAPCTSPRQWLNQIGRDGNECRPDDVGQTLCSRLEPLSGRPTCFNFPPAPWRTALVALTVALLWMGCAGPVPQQSEADARQQYLKGQEDAFDLMQRSGIPLVRVTGPVQRAVLLWKPDLGVGEAIVEAGYLKAETPSRILIQRIQGTIDISPARVLAGEFIPLQSGDILQIIP